MVSWIFFYLWNQWLFIDFLLRILQVRFPYNQTLNECGYESHNELLASGKLCSLLNCRQIDRFLVQHKNLRTELNIKGYCKFLCDPEDVEAVNK